MDMLHLTSLPSVRWLMILKGIQISIILFILKTMSLLSIPYVSILLFDKSNFINSSFSPSKNLIKNDSFCFLDLSKESFLSSRI